MTCAHCRDAGEFFGDATARRDLKRYRRKGPLSSTRKLLDALRARGVEGAVLLDVGGGVGAVQHELLGAGVARAVNVDASVAYQEAARAEAERRGHAHRVDFLTGDAVELAPDLPEAEVVTLDRVICCYPDMPALVEATASRALRLYGIVVPREVWWIRLGLRLTNGFLALRGSAFRVYLHPTGALQASVEERGMRRVHRSETLLWQVMVFERTASARAGSARVE